MPISIPNIFAINGVIDTSKSALTNINTIAAACSSWVTFDIHTGKWSVVINQPGDSVASFNDSNIIGSISISGSGITELYNKVELEYPHTDLSDRVDTITYEIPALDRFPYEYDNTLKYQFDCINNPVQAEYLAAIQLKQSRVDKVIKFRTDFTKLGLKAGDIIDVTSDMYGYVSKKFRVLTVTEADNDDYTIVIDITAFEYDEDVYSTSGLVRSGRTKENGIIGSCLNNVIADSEQAANEASIMKLLVPLALSSLFNMMFPNLNKKLFEALNNPKTTIEADANACEGSTVVVSVQVCCSSCDDLSDVEVDYEITGVTAADIGVPLTGTLTCNESGVATISIPLTDDGISEGIETLTFTANGTSKEIKIHDLKTYELNPSSDSIIEGQTVSIAVTTTGVPNGPKPYSISGSGLSQLVGPTTGTVTIGGGVGTINIATNDIDALADTDLTVTFDPGVFYCAGSSVTITIGHTGTPPPEPPADTNCEWVTIPASWCGTFDGTTGAMKTVFPVSTITVLKAIPGQPSITVPLTASVTGTTITITSNTQIDANTSVGGKLANIITSFNPVTSGVKRVTGTTVQVAGY